MPVSKCSNCALESSTERETIRLDSPFPLPYLNPSSQLTEWTTSTYAQALKTIFSVSIEFGEFADGAESSLCSSCAAILERLFCLYAQLTAVTSTITNAGAARTSPTPWTQFFQILKQRSMFLEDGNSPCINIKLDLDALYPDLEVPDDFADAENLPVPTPRVDISIGKRQKEALIRPCSVRIQRCDDLHQTTSLEPYKRRTGKLEALRRQRQQKLLNLKHKNDELDNQNFLRDRKPVIYSSWSSDDEHNQGPNSPQVEDPDFEFGEEEQKLSEPLKKKILQCIDSYRSSHKAKPKSMNPRKRIRKLKTSQTENKVSKSGSGTSTKIIRNPKVAKPVKSPLYKVIRDSDGKPESYECLICGKRLASASGWHQQRHEKLKLKPQSDNEPLSSGPSSSIPKLERYKVIRNSNGEIESYECFYCDKRLTTSRGINDHMLTHYGIKPFKCNICEKSFYNKRDLGRHKGSHTGDRPHLCEICGKNFRRPEWLLDHKKLHGQEKPYLCSICGIRYPKII